MLDSRKSHESPESPASRNPNKETLSDKPKTFQISHFHWLVSDQRRMKQDASNTFCAVKDSLVFCPVPPNAGRNYDEDALQLATIIGEATDECVRAVLLRINLRETFDINFKKVNDFKQVDTIKTLVFLYGKENDVKPPEFIKELKSDGVTLTILRRLYNLFSHKCGSCIAYIKKDRKQERGEVQCIGCGTRACDSCHKAMDMDRYVFCCPPCKARLSNLNIMPNEFIKVKYKRGAVGLGAGNNDDPSSDNEETPQVNESQVGVEYTQPTQTQDRMPPGQRTRGESLQEWSDQVERQ